MPRRSKVLQRKIFIIFLAVLVVALPISMFVLLPSGVAWSLLLEGGALVERFFAFFPAFFAWLTRY